jgi:hypothetical protein
VRVRQARPAGYRCSSGLVAPLTDMTRTHYCIEDLSLAIIDGTV